MTCEGLIKPPQILECIAEVVVPLGVIRLDSERLTIACHCLIKLLLGTKHIAKVVMGIGVVGLDGECPGDEINGIIIIPHLMGDNTKQMQGDGLIGVGLQYPLIAALSLRQATRNVVLHSEVEALLYG